MGDNVSGFLSPPIPGFGLEMLSKMLGRDLYQIDSNWRTTPQADREVIRDIVFVTQGEKFLFIEADPFVSPVVENEDKKPYERFLTATNMRGRVVFFLINDHCGAYGFSVFEDGRLIRHRMHNPFEQPINRERGEPLAIERPWQPAILTEEEKLDSDADELARHQFFRNENTKKVLIDVNLLGVLVEQVIAEEFGFAVTGGFAAHDQAVKQTLYRGVLPIQATQESPVLVPPGRPSTFGAAIKAWMASLRRP